MTEEMMVNMITNCAKMEAALELMKYKMLAVVEKDREFIGIDELNEVLAVAGIRPVEKEKAPTAVEQ